MINHISIGVHNPEKVANVLAELWNGYTFPFPVCPGSFFVLADDNKGTLVEVTPINVVLAPGEGLPDEENFDTATDTEEFEAKFVAGDISPKFVATHLNLNSPLSEQEIKAIAKREGWRCFTANRGGGMFQTIEFWVEDRFMFEVNPPEMAKKYVELFQPEVIAAAFQIPFEPKAEVPQNLNVIG
jgi:hypothetical protein